MARQMFARAEADLDMQRTVFAEQRRGIDRALVRHRQVGKRFLDKRGLAETKLVALAASIEAADNGRIGHRRAL